ncbi:MAG: hypothetical protein RBT62_04870 [Spirochaetia bacterium]|jgi:hypothetical protein|nr:hypothetical protein [Spirochaetia bacterium]
MISNGVDVPRDLDRTLLIGEGYLGLGVFHGDEGLLRVRGYREGVQRSLSLLPETIVAITESIPKTATLVPDLTVWVFADPALSSYAFGLQAYDPFESITASMDKASRCPSSLALALWAALEADLFRFAYDHGFTSALATAHGSDEWRRFAGLNARYRAMIRALVPFGLVPPAWNAWLRDDEPAMKVPGRPARMLERMLTRPIVSVARALTAMVGAC